MAEFKVGEIAILRNCVLRPEHNGCECEIIDMLKVRKSRAEDGTISESLSYLTDHHGENWSTPPHFLKKLPPKDTPTEWDTNLWIPKSMKTKEPA